MFDLSLPLWADVGLFLVAAGAIGVAGVRASSYADRLADRTGLGEAVTGAIGLGLITALPGLVASVVAAVSGNAGLAISNAMGGIAAQTAALAVADVAYPKANLEHAAASAPNMMQTALLLLLLTLVLTGLSGPEVVVSHINPLTVLLLLAAPCAFWLVWRTRKAPMWKPTQTRETVQDEPEPAHERESLAKLAVGLLIMAGVTAVAGAVVAATASGIVAETPMSPVVVGGLFMAVATSLPELVTSIGAVRRGALTLAVSDVIGGNFFDVLFVAAADLAYLKGSLYHGKDVNHDDFFLTVLAVLLNVILLIGLIYRQERGPANIGFESVAMLVVYLGGFLILSMGM